MPPPPRVDINGNPIGWDNKPMAPLRSWESVPLADPETGEIVDLSPDEAADAFVQGRYDLDAGQTYQMELASTGDVGEVAPENVAEMLSLGGRFITKAEIDRRAQVADSDTVGGSLAAFANQALLGVPALIEEDVRSGGALNRNIQRGIMGDGTDAEPVHQTGYLSAATEANPTAATVGEFAGYATAAIPGMAAENALLRSATAAGGGLLKRMGTRALTRGAIGAAENAAIGQVDYFSDVALGEQQFSAESLLAAAGRDALIGAGANVAFGGAIDAVGGAASILGEVTQRIRAGAGSSNAISRGYGRAVSAITGDAEAGAIAREFTEDTAEGRAKRAIVARGDAVFEDGARSIRRAGDVIEGDAKKILELATGEGKASRIRELARGNDLGSAEREARGLLDEMEAKFREILDPENLHEQGHRKTAKNGISRVAATRRELSEAIARGDEDAIGDVFISMDRFKRGFQKDIKAGGVGNDHFPDLDALQNGLRHHLEDVRLYGKAGEQQIAINKAWTDYLSTIQRYDTSFKTQMGQDGFRPVYTFDPAKAETYLHNLGRARNDLAEEALELHFRNQERLVNEIANHYDLSGEMAAKLSATQASAKEMQKTLSKVRYEVTQANKFAHLQKHSSIGTEAAALGWAAGKANPVLGAGVGAVAYAASNPSKMVRMVSRLDGAKERVKDWINKSAKDALSSKASPRLARVRERMASATATARRSGKVIARGGQSLARGYARPALAERYTERFDRLRADSSEKKHDQVAANIRSFAPGISAMAAQTASRADAFLQSKIPVGALPSNTLQPHLTRPRVSDAEMAKFLRYARAVDEPLTVIEDLADGALTREGVEAVRAVYPSLFSAMQSAVMTAVTESTEALAYDKRVQIGLLLDVPTDPSLAPGAIVALQSAYKSPNKLAPPPARLSAPKMSAALLTDTQRVAST